MAGVACGLALARLAGSYFEDVRMPGVLPIIGSALVLLAAAVIASISRRPAPRASTLCRPCDRTRFRMRFNLWAGIFLAAVTAFGADTRELQQRRERAAGSLQ